MARHLVRDGEMVSPRTASLIPSSIASCMPQHQEEQVGYSQIHREHDEDQIEHQKQGQDPSGSVLGDFERRVKNRNPWTPRQWQVADEQECREQARVAGAKMLHCFENQKMVNVSKLERNSVYGAAILVPQVARSTGWPKSFVFLSIQSYFFLIANCGMQSTLLVLIQKEQKVMNLFGGQMHLCDFGAHLDNCPNGPGCTGPAGSNITAPRMYSYPLWSTRTFVRDSLKTVFPRHANSIDEKIDPGEYGVESYSCRCLCCFIFMMHVIDDAILCYEMFNLLYSVPPRTDLWIEPHEEGDSDDTSELAGVRIKVAGMPRHWKALNFLVVFIPKVLIWKLTAQSGVMFLMETSDIADTVINTVGLTFVLQIDEIICETMMSKLVNKLLEDVEDMSFCGWTDNEAVMSDGEIMEKHNREQHLTSITNITLHDILDVLPKKFLCTIALTLAFLFDYYFQSCVRSKDGAWVSHSMYLPKSTSLSWLVAFFPDFFETPSEPNPFWQMPDSG